MYSERENLMAKIPILEHSNIQEHELAAILLVIWSNYIRNHSLNHPWVIATSNQISTLRELIKAKESNVQDFVVRGLISEVRHFDGEVDKLISEAVRRRHINHILRVLGFGNEHYGDPETIYDILRMGAIRRFNSPTLNNLGLRERQVLYLSLLLVLGGVDEDGKVVLDNIRSKVASYLEDNCRNYKSESALSDTDLRELLDCSSQVTASDIRSLDADNLETLFPYTTMRSLSEVIGLVRVRKEILFSDPNMTNHEQPVTSYPSLTEEGIMIGKVLAYTYGRMKVDDRRTAIMERLAEIQKDKSILLFAHPGKHEISTAECIRLSDNSARFVSEMHQRLDKREVQEELIGKIDQLGLLS